MERMDLGKYISWVEAQVLKQKPPSFSCLNRIVFLSHESGWSGPAGQLCSTRSFKDPGSFHLVVPSSPKVLSSSVW